MNRGEDRWMQFFRHEQRRCSLAVMNRGEGGCSLAVINKREGEWSSPCRDEKTISHSNTVPIQRGEMTASFQNKKGMWQRSCNAQKTEAFTQRKPRFLFSIYIFTCNFGVLLKPLYSYRFCVSERKTSAISETETKADESIFFIISFILYTWKRLMTI